MRSDSYSLCQDITLSLVVFIVPFFKEKKKIRCGEILDFILKYTALYRLLRKVTGTYRWGSEEVLWNFID